MNAIVIVFMPRTPHNNQNPGEGSFAVAIIDNSSRDLLSKAVTTRDPSAAGQFTPPFWTWFIENPRGSAA